MGLGELRPSVGPCYVLSRELAVGLLTNNLRPGIDMSDSKDIFADGIGEITLVGWLAKRFRKQATARIFTASRDAPRRFPQKL